MRREQRFPIEYSALRGLEILLSVIPRPVALVLGAWIGVLLHWIGFKRSIAEKNLAYIGLWDHAHQRLILKHLYRNIGRYAADFVLLSSKPPPYVVKNHELIDTFLARGKGVLVILAHFGNWEILANIFGGHISGLTVLAKPMRNRMVERWLADRRKRTGVDTVYQQHAVRKAYQVLKRNGMLALLIDQHSANNGTMAPFLGKEANTIRTVAGLLLRTDCAILPAHALLREDGIYEITLEETADLGVSRENEDAFMAAYQAEHNEIISAWIRQYPEHWFGWFHRRFRENIQY